MFALISLTTVYPRGKASQGRSGLEAEQIPQRLGLVLYAIGGVSVAGLGDASTCIKPCVCLSCGSAGTSLQSPASCSQRRLCLDQCLAGLEQLNFAENRTSSGNRGEPRSRHTDICIRGTHLGWMLGPVSAMILTQIITPRHL